MGMYTEFFFRAELRKETPPELVDWLANALNPGGLGAVEPFDDDPFFTCPRWQATFWSISYSHPPGESNFWPSDGIRQACIVIHSSLKNYGSEIEAFVDWIKPWVSAFPGEFLGYSLYEDSRADGDWDSAEDRDRPQLIFMD